MLGNALLRVAGERADAPAMIGEGRHLSYRQLADGGRRWASLLDAELGARRGDPVAVQASNGPDYALVLAALAVLDVPLLPVHPQWTPAEVIRALGGRTLGAVIAARGVLEAWREAPGCEGLPRVSLESLQERAAHAVPRIPKAPAGDRSDLEALCLMTSGTTSAPRLVVRTQGNLLANARQVGGALGWQPGWRVLPVTPFHHANGFSNGLLLPLLRGACIVVMPQYFPARLAALVREHPVDVLLASPVVYASLLSCPDAGAALSGVQQALSSGAPLPADVAAAAAARWGLQIRELYGTSETGTIAIEPRRSPDLPRSAGLPVQGVSLAIVEESGQPVPPGSEGLVAVRSPAVMKGYWTMQGPDPARDAAGWYRTGDVGLIDERGELQLRGRRRAFVNVGGNKVDPREIETVLLGLPGVSRARVHGQPHPLGGEMVCATVFVRQGGGLDRAAVLAQLRAQLAEYKIPRRLELQPEHPADVPDKHGTVYEGSAP